MSFAVTIETILLGRNSDPWYGRYELILSTSLAGTQAHVSEH
jgi:hypothetical protein